MSTILRKIAAFPFEVVAGACFQIGTVFAIISDMIEGRVLIRRRIPARRWRRGQADGEPRKPDGSALPFLRAR